jgi:DNA-binding NarL/FixJ family response regulator
MTSSTHDVVLVVAGDETRAEAMREVVATMRASGTVHVATTDTEAIAKAFSFQPALVLLDLQLTSPELHASLRRAAPACRVVVAPR